MGIKRLDKEQSAPSEKDLRIVEEGSLDDVLGINEKTKSSKFLEEIEDKNNEQIYYEWWFALCELEDNKAIRSRYTSNIGDFDKSLGEICEQKIQIDADNLKIYVKVNGENRVSRFILNEVRKHMKSVFGQEFLVIPKGD